MKQSHFERVMRRFETALFRKRHSLAVHAGSKDNQQHIQNVMSAMYREAELARAFQDAKVKAAEDAAEAAHAAVDAQLQVIKSAQRKLEGLYDKAAEASHTVDATRQSRDAFLKLLPEPGVQK